MTPASLFLSVRLREVLITVGYGPFVSSFHPPVEMVFRSIGALLGGTAGTTHNTGLLAQNAEVVCALRFETRTKIAAEILLI